MIWLADVSALKVKVCFRRYHGMHGEVATTIHVYLKFHYTKSEVKDSFR